MPKTAITAAAAAKKPTTPERKAAPERPHKDLTQTQEEIADLASDLILNEGAREDVDLLLTALLRHRVRRSSYAGYFSKRDPSETDRVATSSANNLRDRFYEGLAKHWSETRNEPHDAPKGPVPTTVADLMRSNVRRELRNNFEEFIRDSHGVEPAWLFNEILQWHNCGETDIAGEFSTIMHLQEVYVRVPHRHKERIEEFVEFLQKERAA